MANAVVCDKVEYSVGVVLFGDYLVEGSAVLNSQKYGAGISAQGFSQAVTVVLLCGAGFFVLFYHVGIVVLGGEGCDEPRLGMPAHLLPVKIHAVFRFADEVAVCYQALKVFFCVGVYGVGVRIRTLGQLYFRANNSHKAERPSLGLLACLLIVHHIVGKACYGFRFAFGRGESLETSYFHTEDIKFTFAELFQVLL